MSWYRYRWAELQTERMLEMYQHPEERPILVALEGEEIEEKNSQAFNAVLYFDRDMKNEKNDFFFETLGEALKFLEEEYGVLRNHWNLHLPALEMFF